MIFLFLHPSRVFPTVKKQNTVSHKVEKIAPFKGLNKTPLIIQKNNSILIFKGPVNTKLVRYLITVYKANNIAIKAIS